jgi:hypothetical protein
VDAETGGLSVGQMALQRPWTVALGATYGQTIGRLDGPDRGRSGVSVWPRSARKLLQEPAA